MASSAVKYDLKNSQFFKYLCLLYIENATVLKLITIIQTLPVLIYGIWNYRQHVNQVACLYLHAMIVTDNDS